MYVGNGEKPATVRVVESSQFLLPCARYELRTWVDPKLWDGFPIDTVSAVTTVTASTVSSASATVSA